MFQRNSTIRFLYGLQVFGMKAGLHNIRILLRSLGNPERLFPTVHVAGTNGKGSTSAMISAILRASGYRTGLYTSPHLVDFSERIRVEGLAIPPEAIVAYVRRLKPVIERTGATFFEAVTAIAFRYFADRRVDVAIVETGLGGRLDATNTITPLLSVITNIGLEHTEQLGNTLERIAFEKGGIIKPRVPCLVGADQPECMRKLKGIASGRKSRIEFVDAHSSSSIRDRTLEGLTIDVRTGGRVYPRLEVSLPGDHQARNAQVAILSALTLRRNCGFTRINGGAIRGGLRSIRKLSGLRGRMELLRGTPMLIADVAHNPDGIHALTIALRRLGVRNCITVFGVMSDKDYRSMLRLLSPLSRLSIGVRPRVARALDAGTIVNAVHDVGGKALYGGTVHRGLRMALEAAREEGVLLVTGSHYTVGEAINSLESAA